MRKIVTLLLVLMIFLGYSCKKDTETIGRGADKITVAKLPKDACSLISEDQVKEIMGIEGEELEVMNGNRNKESMNSVSCFYKWNDANFGSCGVMVQVQRNPLPDEIQNFTTTYFDNKRNRGEADFDTPGVRFKYIDFTKDTPYPTIYSDELDRYYFAKDQMLLYSVAFNFPVSQDDIDGYFQKIAKIMAENI